MSDILIEDVDVDTVPGDIEQIEYPCQVCGKEAGPYSGRGRKPKYCADHKASNKGTSKSGPKTTGKNAQLAGQAADTLVQYNGLVALVAALAQYPYMSDAITNANDVFREQAYAALLTDPNLCQQIMRGGGISGRAMLILAYGTLFAAVSPVAVMEYKAHKAAKEAALEDA